MISDAPRFREIAPVFCAKELAPVGRFVLIFCVLNLFNGLGLSLVHRIPDVDAEYFRGSAVVLFAVVPGMFGYCASFFERKRRHLIFLRSLPVSSRFIVWMKFGIGWGTTILLTGAAAIPMLVSGRGPKWIEWLVIVALMADLIAALLLSGVLARNEIAQISPLLLVMFSSVLSTNHWPDLFGWVAQNATTLIVTGAVGGAIMLEAAAAVLEQRELDW